MPRNKHAPVKVAPASAKPRKAAAAALPPAKPAKALRGAAAMRHAGLPVAQPKKQPKQPKPIGDQQVMYSRKQVADLLGVSRATVFRWIHSEGLKQVALGPCSHRIRKEDLDAFIAQRAEAMAVLD